MPGRGNLWKLGTLATQGSESAFNGQGADSDSGLEGLAV